MMGIDITLEQLFKDLKKGRGKGLIIQNVALNAHEVEIVAMLASMVNQTGKAYDPWGKYSRIFKAYGLRVENMTDGSRRISRGGY